MNILGIFAIAVALGLSAFTAPAKSAAKRGSGDYWFLISGTFTPSQAVTNSNATFLQQSNSAPSNAACGSATTHQCVSAFTSSQVNTSTDQITGSQVPDATPGRKM